MIASCPNELYLKGRISENDPEEIEVPIETYIAIFVLVNCENYNLKITFIDMDVFLPFSLPRSSMESFSIRFSSKMDWDKENIYCHFPLITMYNKRTIIGGLCAVLRAVIKDVIQLNSNHPAKSLLGFRGNCLVSCSENSVWTKFCELDFPQSTESIATNRSQELPIIPECVARLESHLQAPTKTHNIAKRKQDLLKMFKSMELEDNQLLASGNVLEHCFLEGIDFTLADVVILPCVYLLFDQIHVCMPCVVPLIHKWYNRVVSMPFVQKTIQLFQWNELRSCQSSVHVNIVNQFKNEGSLYSRSLNCPKGKSCYLNPTHILTTLKINGIVPDFVDNNLPKINWDELPEVLHPSHGDLPLERIERKCQQLENIVSAACRESLPNQMIVDFCSGGGHVGLLLAYMLPSCQIILVENKEDSLFRARKRAETLELENIQIYQCNMDYFNGPFDIGVSLHACGIATDLVLVKCMTAKATFVCCPCCYGAIHSIDGIQYPLSKAFSQIGITEKDFSVLARCADRTEKKIAKLEQGLHCMGLVDMDRVLFARELGYEVKFMKMSPVTCSPKHNLLIGKSVL